MANDIRWSFRVPRRLADEVERVAARDCQTLAGAVRRLLSAALRAERRRGTDD
jgi:hypothetical protein